MLYKVLKPIAKVALKTFFRNIEINNIEKIPSKGPIIFTANHQSAFTDPLVIAAFLNREVNFIAKGELFKSPFARWILSQMRMIPVFRKDKTPELAHKNEAVFEKCHSHLQSGGAIIIFPEGISKVQRTIKKLKTGTARIALGAESASQFVLGTKIVPVGLSYSNQNKFRSRVSMNIGEPIDVSTYQNVYQKDEFEAVNFLTDNLKEKLEELTVNGLSQKPTQQKNKLIIVLWLLACFPLYLLGIINNILPYKLTQITARKITKRQDFLGSMFLSLGIIFFPLCWALQTAVVHYLCENVWFTAVYLVVVPLSGWLVIYYFSVFRKFRKQWGKRKKLALTALH